MSFYTTSKMYTDYTVMADLIFIVFPTPIKFYLRRISDFLYNYSKEGYDEIYILFNLFVWATFVLSVGISLFIYETERPI